MVGKELSPTLVRIEEALWEFEGKLGIKPDYTTDGFRASIKIFMSALMDKIWEVQEWDKMGMEDRGIMVEKAGSELRQFIKTYTGIDTHELYK